MLPKFLERKVFQCCSAAVMQSERVRLRLRLRRNGKCETPRPQGGAFRKGNLIFIVPLDPLCLSTHCAPRPIGPLNPAYKAGLAEHLPVKVQNPNDK